MNNVKRATLNKVITWVFFFSFVVAIGSNFNNFLFKKNYNYLVEASCDPAIENCFYRDCESAPDDCPPNGLSYYKSYYVDANDFKKCTDNSCLMECTTELIQCEPITCDEENGDICEGGIE